MKFKIREYPMRDLWMVWDLSQLLLLPLSVLFIVAWKRDWSFFAKSPDTTFVFVAIPACTTIVLIVYSKLRKSYEISEKGINYRKNRKPKAIPFDNVRVYYYERDKYGREDKLVIEEWDKPYTEAHTIPIRKLRKKDASYLIETMRLACTGAAEHPKNIFRTSRPA